MPNQLTELYLYYKPAMKQCLLLMFAKCFRNKGGLAQNPFVYSAVSFYIHPLSSKSKPSQSVLVP